MGTTTDPVLAVATSKLTKSFGPETGVFDLDIGIQPGSIVGFIGPSGSGKTTTVRLMTGVITPDSGDIEVFGQSPSRFSKKSRARIGYMVQQPTLYPDLTLRENLNFAASLYGIPHRRRRIRRLIELMELEDAMARLPRDASGGEQKRVMLAGTLVHQPDLMFLDEPTAGVDPLLRAKFWDHFKELASGGSTLVVTTQYVGEAAYCDYVAVLANGRVLTVDTPEGLRKTAYGGEVIEVSFAEPPGFADVASLRATGKETRWVDEKRLRLVVEDPESAAAELSSWARDRGLELTKTETFLPPFDDVFVELVSRLEQAPEEAPDTG
jgi:ABC-2 type transport system ATP-binding protein